MSGLLETIDKEIAKTRNKSQYRHNGKRETTIKTLMGEVTYDRILYETKMECGEKAFVFLLDSELKLDTCGKISSNLAARIAECVSVSSYREAAKDVSSMMGQSISHGGVWNVVQTIGKRFEEIEIQNSVLAKQGQGKGSKEAKILFEG